VNDEGLMKSFFLPALCTLVFIVSSFAEPPTGLPTPTREQLESVIGGMGLSMGDKLSLRSILQDMRDQVSKVTGNTALSDQEKSTQIIGIRKAVLAKTEKILTADQQGQLSALLLPAS
jgi:hypothetical protein